MKVRSSGHAFGLRIPVRFPVYFAVGAIILVVALSLYAYQRLGLEQEKLRHTESLRLDLASRTVNRNLKTVVSDLRRLAQSQILSDYLQHDSLNNRLRLQNAFINLAAHTAIYDQVRYIDHNGHERVRVNFNNGSPVAVQDNQLQDKSERYYYRAALGMKAGQVYFSPLDLNVEAGEIEQPFKPTIRVAMRQFDPGSGEPRGVLVLNYLAAQLLEQFREVMTGSWGEAFLLNEQGYWLFSPNAQDEWGFMRGNDQTFSRRYPQAWKTIIDSETGTLRNSEGLFIFNTVRPQLIAGLKAPDNHDAGYAWKLVSRVEPERLVFSPWRVALDHPQESVLLVLLTGMISLILAWLRTANVQKAKRLRESEEQLRQLVEQAPDGIFIADLGGRYVDVNTAGCKMLGYSREEIIGKTIVDLIPQEDIDRLWQLKEQLLQGGAHVSEWTLLCKDGSYLPVEISTKVLPDSRWQGFVRDIRDRKRSEEQLRQAATVFDNTMEGIVIADAGHKIVAINQAYTEITGFGPEESVGRNPRLHKSGQHDEVFYRNMWDSLERNGHWQGEIWNRRKNGEMFPAWENISIVKDSQGRVTHYISVMSDISPIKQAEERLTYLAHHDVLTDLPNRLAFLATLEKALERAKRHRQKLALLFLDLDHFKLINDTLGHATGDRLLQVIAQRLRNNLRAEDMAARLGGDEFTIIMEEINHTEDAALLAQKIIRAVAEPIRLDSHEVVSTTSIGISIYPDDADNAGDLAKAADAAMYRAKNHGRQTYEYYTTELTAQARQRFSVENALRQALARDELTLFYQPQIDLATGRTLGVEALLRWRHPQMGMILPGQFIEVAEESGLIDAIGNWVLHRAVAQGRVWQEAGLSPGRIAVNLSGRQIIYDHTVESVRNALEQNGYEPGDLPFELEVTESVLQSGKKTMDSFTQLRSLGMSIAIDDFGMGYSSLSQLKHLPIDTLKIDRSFLRDIPHEADNMAITTAILSMGRSLGLRVIAEGVETREQLDFLKQQGCGEVQGFLFCEAVPPERIGAFLAQDRLLLVNSGYRSNQ